MALCGTALPRHSRISGVIFPFVDSSLPLFRFDGAGLHFAPYTFRAEQWYCLCLILDEMFRRIMALLLSMSSLTQLFL